jgi:hypothetical protein
VKLNTLRYTSPFLYTASWRSALITGTILPTKYLFSITQPLSPHLQNKTKKKKKNFEFGYRRLPFSILLSNVQTSINLNGGTVVLTFTWIPIA